MLRKSVIGLAAAIVLAAGSTRAGAQEGVITYQGQLMNAGSPVSSNTDMAFTLWTAPTGGAQVGPTVTSLAIPVVNGLFTAPIDFGTGPFASAQALYLQVQVRNPAGTGSYVTLGSRQLLTPTGRSLATRGIDVTTTGNVGIGTANAAAKLQVEEGPIFSRFVPVSSAPNLMVGAPLATSGVQSAAIGFLGTGIINAGIGLTPVTIGTGASRLDFTFGSSSNPGWSSTPVMSLSSVSTMGINTTATDATVNVLGIGPTVLKARSLTGGTTAEFEAPGGVLTVYRNSSTPNRWEVLANDDAYTLSRSAGAILNTGFSINRISGNMSIGGAAGSFKLDVIGAIRCTALTQTSAREFKQDITPLTGALESIMKLRGVTYAWNELAPEGVRGERDIGFLADEMNEVLPDIVAKDAGGKPIGIDYGKVTPVTVEAIKQLKADVDRKDARIAELERRLGRIESLLAEREPIEMDRPMKRQP